MTGTSVFAHPFCPVPTALLSFRSASGQLLIVPAGWVGIVCSKPSTLSVGFRQGAFARQDLLADGDFAINLPTDELLADARFLEALAVSGSDILEAAGLTLTEGTIGRVPLIAECPVQVECRKGTVQTRFSQCLVTAEVACVHMAGRSYGLERPVNLCRLDPFAALRRIFSGPAGARPSLLGV